MKTSQLEQISEQQGNCLNCATPITTKFCPNCGQDQHYRVNRFFFSMVNEVLEDVLSLNSRFWRTVTSLLFRPGFLSNEFLRGRRASYLHPIRLYLVTSILFFVVLTAIDFFSNSSFDITVNPETANSQTEADRADTPAAPSESAIKMEDGETLKEDAIDVVNSEDSLEIALEDLNLERGSVDISLPFIAEETEAKLEEFLLQQSNKAIEIVKQDPHTITAVLLDLAPPVIFCLVPLFALLLKFGYLGKGIYYAEHLILAVHNHCFVFLLLTGYSIVAIALSKLPVIDSWLGVLVTSWLIIYQWKSLKNVYRQSRTVTTVKFIILGLCYLGLLGFGIAITLFIGFVTL